MRLHPRVVPAPDDPVQDARTLDQIRCDRAAADAEAVAVQRTSQERGVPTVDTMLAGVAVRWYLPEAGSIGAVAGAVAGAAGVIVYVHGGGWVLGSLETVDIACRRLALRAGVPVVSVGYRLAPEHPWPSQLDDVDDVVSALADRVELPGGMQVDPGALVVAGDSAGGWLALAAGRRATDGGRALAGQALVYPVVTRSALDGRATDEGRATDFTIDDMRWFWEMMLGSGPDAVAAAVADAEIGWPHGLEGAPDTLVLLAEHDILRPEGEALADALQTAGVDVVAVTVNGIHHGYFRHPAVFSASRAAIDLVATWARDRLDAASR